MYVWVLFFAGGLHQVIELIRSMQVERIEKIVPWKHKIESRNDQDMELVNFQRPSGLGCLAIAVAIEPGWLHPTPMPRTDSNPLSFFFLVLTSGLVYLFSSAPFFALSFTPMVLINSLFSLYRNLHLLIFLAQPKLCLTHGILWSTYYPFSCLGNF